MANLDKETADKELEGLLLNWSDGLALPSRTAKKPSPDEIQFKTAFNFVSEYIQHGKLYIQEDKICMKNEEHVIEFKVPKGEALMNMGDMDMSGCIKLATSMCGQAPSFFPNGDARLTKRAGLVAMLFMLLP